MNDGKPEITLEAMSNRTLLSTLAGRRPNGLNRWLNTHPGEPSVAWYASAGTDLRDLLYLNSAFRNHSPASADEPAAPEFFIHTDYHVGDHSSFLDHRVVHLDDRTQITVKVIEELPRLALPLHEDLVAFGPSSATDRVIYLELDVVSDRLGTFRAPMLYVFVENSAFCARMLLPHAAHISHVVQVRYGHGLGGGRAGPEWLRRQLGRLRTEVFVTDEHDSVDCYKDEVYLHFPELQAAEVDTSKWSVIRQLPFASWEGYGRVSWLRVPSLLPR